MRRWTGKVLLGLISFYQRGISPLTPATCRFEPSCSEYARQAIEGHGPLKGSGYAVRRLLRCHPFGSHGYDPVPNKKSEKEGRTVPAAHPMKATAPTDGRGSGMEAA